MKNVIKNGVLATAFALSLASCKPELTKVTPTKGNLDLTSYVALGNSLTSGYQDNGLFYEGQKSSYVNVLADQFKLVKPDLIFNVPYVSPSSTGCAGPDLSFKPELNLPPNPTLTDLAPLQGKTFTITINVPAPYTLQRVKECDGKSGLLPEHVAPYGDGQLIMGPTYNNETGATYTWGPLGFPPPPFPTISTAPSIYASQGFASGQGFNNMGVPGVKAIELNKMGLGGSKLAEINTSTFSFKINNPFFSRFAKDQDNSSILSDAMLMNPTFFSLFIGNNDVLLWAIRGGITGIGTSSITAVQEFNDSITNVVKIVNTTAKQGIIVNIPQITSAAFFTYNKPDVTKYIVDETQTVRLMTSRDMLLLTTPPDSLQCGLDGFGTISYPIPKKYTLTANQVDLATTAIDSYNAKIKELADAYGFAFFDMNAFTRANQSGTDYNGLELSGTFVTGGIFSLDGLHLTPRGYAAVANGMIEVINEKYGSTLPGVDLTKYNGVNFPK